MALGEAFTSICSSIAPVTIAAVNGVELFHETLGDPQGDPVLLVAGLGVQMIDWPDHFVDPFVSAGQQIIRYDNRDIGLSTQFHGGFGEPLKMLELALTEQPLPELAYSLNDMADDGAALLDHLEIESAHVIGSSMGGMIAQALAIRHPNRVRSLTSIMSTTGNPEVGQPEPAAMEAITAAGPTEVREERIAHGVKIGQVWASPGHFNEAELRAMLEADWDRVGGAQAENGGRQLCAIMAAEPRDEHLRQLTMPTLVVHGDKDPLVTPSGGIQTADCVPGAALLMVPGMAHDLAPAFCPQIIEAIDSTFARA